MEFMEKGHGKLHQPTKLSIIMENLGGYGESSLQDKKGVQYLVKILESTDKIRTDIDIGGTKPNLDGSFQILTKVSSKYVPDAGTFEVQVKTLNHDYRNDNKRKDTDKIYKYSCETKVFNVVKKATTLNPVILFLVDYVNEKIFWLYIDSLFVFKLNLKDEDHKIIFFGNENLISSDNLDDKINKFKEIYVKKQAILNSGEKNLIVSNNLDDTTIRLLENEIDYFNALMDGDLSFLKEELFADVWKFGIAYIKNAENMQVGLFRIKHGENSKFIRVFGEDDYLINNKSRIFSIHWRKPDTPIHTIIQDILSNLVQTYFSRGCFSPKLLPTVVLEEVAYDFLDQLTYICPAYENPDFPSVYYKDIENIANLEAYWNSLYQVACDFWWRKTGRESSYIYPYNPFGSVSSKEKDWVMIFDTYAKNLFFELSQSPDKSHKSYPYHIVFEGQFNYMGFMSTLNELKERNITQIHRIWIHKNFPGMRCDLQSITDPKIRLIANGYTFKDYYENINRLLSLLPSVYNECLSKTFAERASLYLIKGKYDIYFDPSNVEFTYMIIKSNNLEFAIECHHVLEEELTFDKIRAKGFNGDRITMGGLGLLFSKNTPLNDQLQYLLCIGICKKLGLKYKKLDFLNMIQF